MVHENAHSFEICKLKDVGEGKTEKQDHKDPYRTIRKETRRLRGGSERGWKVFCADSELL